MFSSHPHHPTLRRCLALALATSLALAACGGGEKEEPDATPAETATTEPPAPILSPLTGETVRSEPDHPIVIVKIDNSSASAPQVGLGSADLVTEELVEGGITRLAVFFDQKIPKNVGPVRSMRATDIGIIKPANAVLVASGGAPQTVGRVRDAKITTFTEGATGYYRESSRYSPYNLFMRLTDLVKTIKTGKRPTTYLPFAEDDSAFPGGRPAKGIDAVFSGASTTSWQFKNGEYVNTDSYAADGDRFNPATVLVLRVKVGDAGYRDPAGNPVPETIFEGKGEAMVFHGGKVVRGTWIKDGLDGLLKLSTAAGELLLPPGKVWIELVPADGGNVVIRK
ncbi:MAG TPA: DUF3048 domain-containing protein [Nocardioidaceae bacterium]|nr:DUF3048 domain-containing protein [Nocardioidaceae bacterium]